MEVAIPRQRSVQVRTHQCPNLIRAATLAGYRKADNTIALRQPHVTREEQHRVWRIHALSPIISGRVRRGILINARELQVAQLPDLQRHPVASRRRLVEREFSKVSTYGRRPPVAPSPARIVRKPKIPRYIKRGWRRWHRINGQNRIRAGHRPLGITYHD